MKNIQKKTIPAVLLLTCIFAGLTSCPLPQTVPPVWNALLSRDVFFAGDTGCWEGYNPGGDPGMYYEFPGQGLNIDFVHPEYFTTIKADGSLEAPGYQDAGHQGQASIDYAQLIDLCDGYKQHNTEIFFGLFIHNFETVAADALVAFLSKWSLDLANLGISSIVFAPAWEIQGQWAAWAQGATRDCYIDPADFNSQMAVFRYAVDKAMADNPGGAIINLGAVPGGWVTNPYYNINGYTAMDYLPGVQLADVVGLDYYPVKSGTPGGPEDAVVDAAYYYQAIGTSPVFGLAEYSFNNDPATGGIAGWTETEKIDFIESTYDLTNSSYPMITFIHWWFVGRGPTNARICFE